MNDTIKTICQALKQEAEAVISYTDRIALLAAVAETKSSMICFEKARLDCVEHIQNLCLELTKLTAGEADDSGGEDDV